MTYLVEHKAFDDSRDLYMPEVVLFFLDCRIVKYEQYTSKDGQMIKYISIISNDRANRKPNAETEERVLCEEIMRCKLYDFFILINDLISGGYIKPFDNRSLILPYAMFNSKYVFDEDYLCKSVEERREEDENYVQIGLSSGDELYDEYLSKYKRKTVFYPTPLLEDLVNNEFKSVEQRRFEEQLEDERTKHKQQMTWARWTVVAAVIAPNLEGIWCVIKLIMEFIREMICN